MNLLRKSEIEKKRQNVASERYLEDAKRIELSRKVVSKLNDLEADLKEKKKKHKASLEKLEQAHSKKMNKLDNDYELKRNECLDIIANAELKEKQLRELEDDLSTQREEIDNQQAITDQTLETLVEEIEKYNKAKDEAEKAMDKLRKDKHGFFQEVQGFEKQKKSYEQTHERHKKEMRKKEEKNASILKQVENERIRKEAILQTIQDARKALDKERDSFSKLKARYARR